MGLFYYKSEIYSHGLLSCVNRFQRLHTYIYTQKYAHIHVNILFRLTLFFACIYEIFSYDTVVETVNGLVDQL